MSPPSPSPGTPEQSPGEPAAVVDPDARRNLPEQLRRRSSFDAGGRSPPQSKEEKTHAWEAFLLKRMGKQAVPASGYVTAEEALDSVASLLSEMGAFRLEWLHCVSGNNTRLAAQLLACSPGQPRVARLRQHELFWLIGSCGPWPTSALMQLR